MSLQVNICEHFDVVVLKIEIIFNNASQAVPFRSTTTSAYKQTRIFTLANRPILE